MVLDSTGSGEIFLLYKFRGRKSSELNIDLCHWMMVHAFNVSNIFFLLFSNY